MDIEKLITLVKDRPEIYNALHPRHRDRDFTSNSWKEIANQLNATGKLKFCEVF